MYTFLYVHAHKIPLFIKLPVTYFSGDFVLFAAVFAADGRGVDLYKAGEYTLSKLKKQN